MHWGDSALYTFLAASLLRCDQTGDVGARADEDVCSQVETRTLRTMNLTKPRTMKTTKLILTMNRRRRILVPVSLLFGGCGETALGCQ